MNILPISTVLYPGSFDPLHLGHVALARYVQEREWGEELWFLPTPNNPLKERPPLFSYEQRCALIAEQARLLPKASLCTIENKLPRPHYTIRTVKALQMLYPNRHFYLLIGSDNWAQWHQWYQALELLKLCSLLVYPRKGFPLPSNTETSGVIPLPDAPLITISATQIREDLKAGKSITDLVPSSPLYKIFASHVTR